MSIIEVLFTAEGSKLNDLQTVFRALTVFIFTLILIRSSKKRFLGKNTAFDVVLTIVLGSILSRSINGSSTFIQAAGACIAISAMHWLLSLLVSKSAFFSKLFEGIPVLLISKGTINRDALTKTHLRDDDILESARKSKGISTLEKVNEAYLENSGDISIIPK